MRLEIFDDVYTSLIEALNADYDIIHVHGLRVPFSAIYGLLSKMFNKRKPIVMTVHTIFPRRSITDSLLKIVYDLTIGKLTIKTFDFFIAISNELKDSLIKFGLPKNNVCVIPLSINLDRFKNIPSKNLFLKTYNIPKDKDMILMIGRLVWQKNLQLALYAFAEAQKEIKDLVLVLVGRDYGYATLIKRLSVKLGIENNVVLTGPISEKCLLSALSAAKIFLITSLYEGFPTALLEAMACKVPTIMTSTSVPVSFLLKIKKMNASLIIHTSTFNKTILALKEGIIHLINEKGLRAKLSQNGRKYVEKYHSWHKNINKFLTIYEKLKSIY